jgi:hypothetical protein
MTIRLCGRSLINVVGLRREQNVKARKSYSVDLEADDAAVTRFLQDLDIALGHDYFKQGRDLFPDFPREWEDNYYDESPLYVRLARAYERLDDSEKGSVKQLVQKALARCARFPLGLRRSLTCVDLAHEIAPDVASERLYSDLMLRPTDLAVRAEFLWQLIRRWSKWNIKVESTYDNWVQAIKEIAPKGILALVMYFHGQNANDQPECWAELRKIALKRIDKEEDALLDVGQNPDLLRTQIASLLLDGERDGLKPQPVVRDPSADDEAQRLLATLPAELRSASQEDLEYEMFRVLPFQRE